MMYTWIIVLVIIALAGILYAGKNGIKISKKESPSEILDRRFANGEISKEEYKEKKQVINSKN
ncbi:SHOCT domain-containing protein [Tenacibaculum sp.]|uniref:SHOCT domain-containing protein n=1 Tax=Tenacibaculum sp. TaxID=1906242 RepID=UPI003D0ADDE0